MRAAASIAATFRQAWAIWPSASSTRSPSGVMPTWPAVISQRALAGTSTAW